MGYVKSEGGACSRSHPAGDTAIPPRVTTAQTDSKRAIRQLPQVGNFDFIFVLWKEVQPGHASFLQSFVVKGEETMLSHNSLQWIILPFMKTHQHNNQSFTEMVIYKCI